MNKVIKILIISIILSLSICTRSFAIGQILADGSNFINDGASSSTTTIDDSKIKSISGTIYNIGFSIGIVVVFTVGAILGIKFIVSGVEEKAEIKETFFPYVISCVVFFGAFGIWKLVVTVLGGII